MCILYRAREDAELAGRSQIPREFGDVAFNLPGRVRMLALDQDAFYAHLPYRITPVFEKLRLQTSPDETRGDK